jgi:uncharacterized protein
LDNINDIQILAESQQDNKESIDQYQPYRIDIVLDNDCNLNCIGCIRVKNKKENVLDYSKFIDRIIKQTKKEKYYIHFTGGEPFLQWDSISKIIYKIKDSTDKEIIYSVYTNLTLLDTEIIRFIKSNHIQIHTSLDGLKHENDIIRGKGSYESIVTNINLLSENQIKLNSLTTTLKNENIQEITTDFISQIDQLKVKVWRLNIDYFGINIEPRNLVDRVFNLYIYAFEKGIDVEGSWLYPFFNLITENKNGFCSATKGETLAILPNGNFSVCPYLESSLGKYTESWNIVTNKFNILKENLTNGKDCNKCIIKDHCHTQCLITKEKGDTKLFDWYCEVYIGLTIKLLKFHLRNEL